MGPKGVGKGAHELGGAAQEMTTRLRTANLEAETEVEEGAGELSVEEKYVEVKQLIALGKEKGFLLYDEIYEVLPEELTSLPEELDEIYIRFSDLGIDVVDDAEKQVTPTSTKGSMVTIDGTIEEKEMDQREEVQADIIAASSGIVDKTNDPVRMYLREMGTVKLLDRQGEVDIAKRIEKGERRVYKALSQNRIILEEILKIFESAKKDTRVIKEMIDLAMPEDDGEPDVPGEPKMPASTLNKINDIMVIFEKVARLDKRIKDQKVKLGDSKPASDRHHAAQRRAAGDRAGVRAAPDRLHTADAQSNDQQAERHRQRAVAERVDDPQGRRRSEARKGQDSPRLLSPSSAEIPGEAPGAGRLLWNRSRRSEEDHPRDPFG